MTQYIKHSNVSLSMQVFLASDNYDHVPSTNNISVTTLLKPVRQIILAGRVNTEDVSVDLLSMAPSRIGTAIHDALERSWRDNYRNALTSLGWSQNKIDKVKINPKPEELTPDCLPVYVEQRTDKKFGNWTVSGKFDIVINGRVEDLKTMSAAGYRFASKKADKFIWQGSIYRWLNPTIITEDTLAIQSLFLNNDKRSVPQQVVETVYPLKSLQETENFIAHKLSELDKYAQAKEEDIPHCSDEELWRGDTVYKYYKNPLKTQRSTKTADSKSEVMLQYVADGSVGLVREIPGKIKACLMCPAFLACTQKDSLIASGELVIN